MFVVALASLTANSVWAQNPFGRSVLPNLKKAAKDVGVVLSDEDKEDKDAGKDKSKEGAAPVADAGAPASGCIGPIVLDKWGRYHTNITIFENTAKKPDGSTDYNKYAWVPKVELVVQMTEPEEDDIMIVQHYKGEEKWGDPIKIPAANITKRSGKNYSLVTATCMMDKDQAISDTGTFSVKVGYKQTGLGKMHEDLATFVYTVKNCNRGWTSQGQIKGFYIDHDFRIGESWLYRDSDGKIHLWTWFKYNREGAEKVRNGRVRCYSGDRKFKFHDNPTRRTEISYEDYNSQSSHQQVTWGLWYWWIPRIEGIPAAEYIQKAPGDYRCVLTQDGEISREFHFTVGDDGQIVRQPFAGNKTIYAVEDSFPLRTELKEMPDLEFDDDAFGKAKLYSRE